MKSKIFLGIVGAFLAIGCSQERPGDGTFNLDVAVEVSVENSKGQDLLNPKTENALNAEDIKLYYVENGKAYEADEEMDDDGQPKKNIIVFQRGDKYRVRILQNHSSEDETPLTLIQWNQKEIDTIKSEFLKGDRYIIQDKIYYNNKLSWTSNDSFEPYFKVVK
ncbi:hypothetical protein [Zunongwangia sp.]|uniref:hypothetical protein n=1 Tax=Zunongwangia sp. TaxID=1965325 RepID=UPI003AA9A009